MTDGQFRTRILSSLGNSRVKYTVKAKADETGVLQNISIDGDLNCFIIIGKCLCIIYLIVFTVGQLSGQECISIILLLLIEKNVLKFMPSLYAILF